MGDSGLQSLLFILLQILLVPWWPYSSC
ncbi:hypothetical protein NC651_034327 [Populus alba x Populus x berolinensis]|nr:hypothetical protein NC651_034327 [Populus alba x Populus x berolinensis]